MLFIRSSVLVRSVFSIFKNGNLIISRDFSNSIIFGKRNKFSNSIETLQAISPHLRFDQKEYRSFWFTLSITTFLGSAAYGLLTWIWFSAPEKFCQPCYLQQILGFRWVSHLGPYFVPVMAKSNVLELLVSQIRAEKFYNPTKVAAIASIEALTQRRLAIMHLSKDITPVMSEVDYVTTKQNLHNQNTDKIEKGDVPQQAQRKIDSMFLQFVFDELVSEKESRCIGKKFTHFEMLLRITLDLLVSLPPESREVSYESICKLVETQSRYWKEKPKYEEYRATLILKLLENRQNAFKILKNEGDCSASPVLDYLYGCGKVVYPPHILPTTGMIFSGECHNLFREAIYSINKHAASGNFIYSQIIDGNKSYDLPLPPPQKRQTITLEKKLDFHGVQQLISITAAWSCLRFLLTPENVSSIGWRSFLPFAKNWITATRGVAFLEIFYRLHESLIESEKYYNDIPYMFKMNAFMTAVQIFLVACITHTHKFVIFPFMILRTYRDGLFDLYRCL